MWTAALSNQNFNQQIANSKSRRVSYGPSVMKHGPAFVVLGYACANSLGLRMAVLLRSDSLRRKAFDAFIPRGCVVALQTV